MGGGSLEEALTELETGRADAVVVLENDLHRHASATRVNAALAKAPLVMVVDHQRTAIMENAHLVLSAASFAESDGTVINNEGRAQRFFQFTIRLITTAKLSCWKAGAGCTRCTAPC